MKFGFERIGAYAGLIALLVLGDALLSQAAANTNATLNIVSQYVKHLSFENPGAEGPLNTSRGSPPISINVNVRANPAGDDQYEVVLQLDARAGAEDEDEVLFEIELLYAGQFRVSGFSEDQRLQVLFIECPRLLFPFARQIIADVSRNGGYAPLMIDPIDFAQMFRQRMAKP